MIKILKPRSLDTSKELFFERTDPALLVGFDPSSKVCTMNCCSIAADPRSAAERKYQCEDCVPAIPESGLTDIVALLDTYTDILGASGSRFYSAKTSTAFDNLMSAIRSRVHR
jgi:hypothetical protein